MIKALVAIASFVAALQSSVANADGPFDPSNYLKERSDADSAIIQANKVNQAEVSIGGRPYIKFSSALGSIYLPKVSNLSKADLERSLCSNVVIPAGCDRNNSGKCRDEERGISSALGARAERPLTQDYVAYADAILRTIEQRCDGTNVAPPLKQRPPTMEVGAEHKGTERQPGGKKAFIRTNDPQDSSPKIKPQAGVGLSF